MGSTVVSASIGLPGLGTPAVMATVAPVPIAAGSTATCAAVSSKPQAALTYEWAIDPAWTPGAGFSASAQPVGAGPTYTMTDADVAALANGKLACRATATTWYAAGSAVTVLAP
jgi:hypothetical protein